MLDEDPELGSESLGRTTGSNEPATEGGIDPAAGDRADATTDGGPEVPDRGEPDTKDVAQTAIKRQQAGTYYPGVGASLGNSQPSPASGAMPCSRGLVRRWSGPHWSRAPLW